MKTFKPLKKLPRYVNAAVNGLIEEIWESARTEDCDDGLSKQDQEALKAYVLRLFNEVSFENFKQGK